MNKKLLAVAVSSALAGIATAQADTANVNVYGKLYPQFQISKADGATDPAENIDSRQAIESTNSAIGFRGDVDVGGGMKGWFKVEQRLRLEAGNGTWSSRNSAAGLKGGFGNVFLGRWDTVFKQLGGAVSFLGVSSGNFVATSATTTGIGFGAGDGSADDASFWVRRQNYIQYETPEMGGFQVLVGYGPDEQKDADTNASVTSLGVKWEAGPLLVSLATDTHNDRFGLSTALDGAGFVVTPGTSSKDTGTRLSAGYKLPTGTSIGATYTTMKWEETDVGEYKHNAYTLIVAQKMGALSFAAEIAKAEEGDCNFNALPGCSTEGLDATQLSLGVRYDFSKRVGLFAIYSQIDNGEAASYNNLPYDIAAGADPQAIAAGVIVTF